MNTFVKIEAFIRLEKVAFYSIRFEIDEEPDELLETDKFFRDYGNPSHDFYDEFATIFAIIKAIGARGATERAFFNRVEERAYALPPKLGSASPLIYISDK